MCLAANSSSILPAVMDAAAIASGNPELLAATALTTGGNYLQTQQNNKSLEAQYSAKNAAAMQGVAQQQPNIAAAQNTIGNTINDFSPTNQGSSTSSIANSRAHTINANTAPATGVNNPIASVSTAPPVVQSALAQKLADAASFNTQQGTALGAVGATGQQLTNNAIDIGNTGSALNQIEGNAKGQEYVNSLQQQAAYTNARKGPSMLGQGLSTAGTLLGLDGLTGGTGASSVGDVINGTVTQPASASNSQLMSTLNGDPSYTASGTLSKAAKPSTLQPFNPNQIWGS